MRDFILDVLVLIRKEALMIVKDKRTRAILVVPVLLQTLLFGYVASYDLNRIDYALLDKDHSASSRELVKQFDGSGIFRRVATLDNAFGIPDMLDGKKSLLVLHIDAGFERVMSAGGTAPVQVLADGRNSNVAGIAVGYATGIVDTFNKSRLTQYGLAAPGVTLSSRAWFNPNLETRWNIISGLVAVLSVIQVMILAGQSVAREKEQGTFDQLLVTPFNPMTILLGKAIPPILIGIGQSTFVLLIALYWFKIPYAGSYWLMYVGLTLSNFTIVGIGLCISALTATMQQAILYTFSSTMIMVLLSGFTTPISSMPQALQWATFVNPVRYGVEFAQRIYLEGASLVKIQWTLWPLVIMAVVTLGMASRLFRSRLG
jgi:ABC-2 type transport system permease protein